MNDDELFYANGIDAETGDYDAGNISTATLSKLARNEKLNDQEKFVIDGKTQANYAYNGVYTDLSDTGWGIVFPTPITPWLEAVREALKPLRLHRQAQAKERYKEFWGPETLGGGYRKGDSAFDFLFNQQAEAGSVNAELVPYYLLLVGSPEEIPYWVQYQLDVTYGVGRVYFDRIEDYAQYAENLVNAENDYDKGKFRLPRSVGFWGVQTPGDRATELSAEHLIKPLATEKFPQPSSAHALSAPDYLPWEKADWVAEKATKAQLGHLLSGGANSPALLFTASHGMAFKKDNNLQRLHQGALLCQDWPGPRQRQPVKEDWYFSATDVSQTANLLGRFAFFFACYGAGTPKIDDYARLGARQDIADRPFVAALPQKLLTQGMFATIGHVERAWGYSFIWGEREALKVFQDTLSDLLYANFPIGAAMEWFNNRYAYLASTLTSQLQEMQKVEEAGGAPNVNDTRLANFWTAQNDARGYVVLGDPAARLLVATTKEQPTDPNFPYPVTSYKAPVDLTPARAEAATTAVAVVAASSNGTVVAAAATVRASTPEATTPALPSADAGATNFVGWFGGDKDKTPETTEANTGTDWTQSLKDFGTKLSDFLTKAIQETVDLEITTYTGEGVTIDELRQEKPANAKLVAATRITLNGNTRLLLPTNEEGRPDQEILALHIQMVTQAQASRAKLVESAITALGSLAKLGK